MHSRYNRVAGQSVERLAALSDGIFAVSLLCALAPGVEERRFSAAKIEMQRAGFSP